MFLVKEYEADIIDLTFQYLIVSINTPKNLFRIILLKHLPLENISLSTLLFESQEKFR